MDVEAVAARQIRVMWVGTVWFLAAFMPLFLVPWRWVPATGVAVGLLIAAGYAAYRGYLATAALGPAWTHLFVTVPALLLLASFLLAFSIPAFGAQY